MSVHHYRQMAHDPSRLSAMRRAIESVIRPGASVADIGCGLGTFAVLACRAGARVVWAVDSEPILAVAGEVARANGCADRVRLLQGTSTALEVPERVDVALYEDYEAGLLSPSIVRTLVDLRERWLVRGGRLVPSRARRLAALVEDGPGHTELELHTSSGERVEGVDLSAARQRALSTARSRRLPGDAILAGPILLDEPDLEHVVSPAVRARSSPEPLRDGLAHGIAIWFELDLGGGWLSTGPGSLTAWSQLLLPFEPPLEVSVGTPLEVELEAHPIADVLHWRWLVVAGAEVRASDTLAGEPLTLGLCGTEALVPRPHEEVEVDRALLCAIDGQTPVTALARLLRERFPHRFSEPSAAAARVLSLLARYTP